MVRQQLTALNTESTDTTLLKPHSAIKEQMQTLFKLEKSLCIQRSNEAIHHQEKQRQKHATQNKLHHDKSALEQQNPQIKIIWQKNE